MSSKRIELQTLLEETLGSRNVYFQPPATISMKYPAIVYSLTDMDTVHANNNTYLIEHAYLVTAIDKNPDSELPDKLASLPKSRFNRSYTSDNLYHFAFKIYY